MITKSTRYVLISTPGASGRGEVWGASSLTLSRMGNFGTVSFGPRVVNPKKQSTMPSTDTSRGFMDTSRLTPGTLMRGEDEEETTFLQEMLVEARAYIRSFNWCPPISEELLGSG